MSRMAFLHLVGMELSNIRHNLVLFWAEGAKLRVNPLNFESNRKRNFSLYYSQDKALVPSRQSLTMPTKD